MNCDRFEQDQNSNHMIQSKCISNQFDLHQTQTYDQTCITWDT